MRDAFGFDIHTAPGFEDPRKLADHIITTKAGELRTHADDPRFLFVDIANYDGCLYLSRSNVEQLMGALQEFLDMDQEAIDR